MFKKVISIISVIMMLLLTGCRTPNQSVMLFNGKDLTGWDGDMKYWTVEDGAITGQITEKNPILLEQTNFLIWRGSVVDDFELRSKYRITQGNSGIQFRSWELENYNVGGYQADFEAGQEYTGALWEGDGRSSLSMRGDNVIIDENGERTVTSLGDPSELIKSVDLTGWNDYLITAIGDSITLTINGTVMTKVIDRQNTKASKSGIIAIQLHGGLGPQFVQVKDIELKRL